jgi:MFS family permease
MYIAEISPAKIRGTMVSFNQLNIVIGISVAFLTNYLILRLSQSGSEWTEFLLIDSHTWRWMLGIEAIPALIYFSALFFVPRSPRWLIMKQKETEAILILKKTNGEANILKEVNAIKQSLITEKETKQIKLRQIFRPAFRYVLIVGIIIAAAQQLTGINSVFFYAPMIFEQSGLGTNASFSQAIYVGLTNLFFTVLAILFIDRIGRKPLLIIGVSGIVVSMFILAWGFGSARYILTDKDARSLPAEITIDQLELIRNIEYKSDIDFKEAIKLSLGKDAAREYESVIFSKAIQINTTLILIAIIAFVASFAISIGPVMWVLFSELFPNSIRAVAISFVGFINSVVSFLVQLVFPWELATLGSSATFLIYGLLSAAGLIFILAKVPETKGKSLEELQSILTK